jgi:hypothetical protein
MSATAADPVIERLEDQISWYDRKSGSNQRAYKRIKIVEIIAAAVIPFAAAFNSDFRYVAYVTGALGVIITILEGLLHLNQYQENWSGYRSTCEALKHEKYCFIAKAADYATAADPRALLAERIESLVSQEHAKWSATQQPRSSQKQAEK